MAHFAAWVAFRLPSISLEAYEGKKNQSTGALIGALIFMPPPYLGLAFDCHCADGGFGDAIKETNALLSLEGLRHVWLTRIQTRIGRQTIYLTGERRLFLKQ